MNEVSCRTSRHQAMMMHDDWLLSLGPLLTDEMLPQKPIYFTKTTTRKEKYLNPKVFLIYYDEVYTWELRND